MLSKRNQTTGIVLIVIGALFLLSQFVNFNVGWLAWPFFVMVPGLLMLGLAVFGNESTAGFAIPGCIVSTIGLILFSQNITGHFESWSYAWALIPMAVGVGIYLQGSLAKEEKLRHDGRQLATIGLILFVAFGAFFELLIFRNFANTFVWRYVLPFVLIVGGAFILMRRQGKEDEKEDLPQDRDFPRTPPQPQV